MMKIAVGFIFILSKRYIIGIQYKPLHKYHNRCSVPDGTEKVRQKVQNPCEAWRDIRNALQLSKQTGGLVFRNPGCRGGGQQYIRCACSAHGNPVRIHARQCETDTYHSCGYDNPVVCGRIYLYDSGETLKQQISHGDDDTGKG